MKHPFILTLALAIFLPLNALRAQTPGALTAVAGNNLGNQIYVNQITTGGDTTFI